MHFCLWAMPTNLDGGSSQIRADDPPLDVKWRLPTTQFLAQNRPSENAV